jgi:type IV pilus assembly protein PilA
MRATRGNDMSNTPATERPSSALPIIALVCFFVCFPLGTILSIVAFVKTSKFPGTEARTLSIVALCLNVLIVPVIGILAAIAIPNFVKFQCRSKQSEAKGNLKALSVAQESYLSEKGEYSRDPAAIGFQPMGANVRYEYVIVQAGKDSYVAEARGTRDGMAGDLWRIDQTRNLANITNACGR